MAATESRPCPVAQEIVRRYADVLRVGTMEVNGQTILWETKASSTEHQLQHFSDALFNRLRELPELIRSSDDVLRQSTYWVCKAVSINYALAEVLMLVRRKAGCMCTILTEDRAGGLVKYAIEARPDMMVHLRLCWRGKNNIVYRDPRTASKKVKGTLSCVETKFPLPPVKRFAPAYRLHMKFKRSLASKFASTMTCKDAKKKQGGAETVLIEDPLLGKNVAAAPPELKDVDDDFDVEAAARIDAVCEELMVAGTLTELSSPCSVYSLHRPSSPLVIGSRGISKSSCTSAVGQLRVQRLFARDVQCHPETDAASVMCCRLSFGAQEKRTFDVPSNENPVWNEEIDFPVLASEEHGHVLLELLSVVGSQEFRLGHACVPASTVLVGSDQGEPALISELLERAVTGSTARVHMELLFLAEGDDILHEINRESI